jgi:hypothetical protein
MKNKLKFLFPAMQLVEISVKDLLETRLVKFIIAWLQGLLAIGLFLFGVYILICLIIWKVIIPTIPTDPVVLGFFRMLLLAYTFLIIAAETE